MSQSQREAELLKQLEAMSITCYVCHQSQEKKRCEILADTSKCKKDICFHCFKLHKADACMTCAQRIEDHHKKTKVSQKASVFDQANKMYHREFKIRSNPEFQNLELGLIDLMAYYNAHPQVSVRKKYEQVQKEIKRILESKNKDQRTIINQSSRIRQAKFDEKKHQQFCTGLESCGYNRRYEKGINLLRVSWGYEALTAQQFQANAELIRKDRGEVSQAQREQEITQLKLTKKQNPQSNNRGKLQERDIEYAE